MKALPLTAAIILDTVQILLGIAFIALQFATPVGGGIGGSLAAGAYCWSASAGILSGIANAVSCAAAGGVVGAGASAFGSLIGGAIDVALSFTVGGGILLLLAFEGMFYPQIVIKGFLGESIPFFNFVPFWTYLVWQSVQEKKRRDSGTTNSSGVFGFVVGGAANIIPGGILAKGAVALAQRRFAPTNPQPQETPTPQAPNARPALLPSRFADIRTATAANGNAPKKAYAA